MSDAPSGRRSARERASALARVLAGATSAGVLLAVAEIVLVVARSRGLFLSRDEIVRFALAALAVITGATALASVLGAGALRRLAPGGLTGEPRAARRVGWTAALCVMPVAAWTSWLLTEGRRVRDLSWRPALVAVLALGAASAAGLGIAALVRLHGRASASRRLVAALALGAGAAVSAAASAIVLPHGYPPFHHALAALSVALAALAGGLARRSSASRVSRSTWVLGAAGLSAIVLAPLALVHLRAAPNAAFATEEAAPLTGPVAVLLRRARVARAPLAPRATRASPPVPAVVRGIDLTGRDMLLVTIDALRADRLAAFGGHGDTPALDRLASESAVLLRAYTSTPHTSYALASILTGKFLRPVLELPDPPAAHPTLPAILRRYGYRTAAFYPPAIFFVDEQRFGLFERDGFGFEYRKAMFAPAAARVEQLEAYLQAADRGHPLFVWVHLFEPHEPYDPPPEFRRGESAVDRYDGEVRAADHAVGELVAAFRRARPSATVIVSADHGEEFGDHGGHYHGTTLYDEQVRIPIVWSSPGAVPPSRLDAPVESVDLATTLLAALGVPRDARMRGDDLGPMLRTGDSRLGPREAFASVTDQWMVTDGTFKAICAEGEPMCRLYDLVHDRAERHNLGPARPAVVDRLRHDLGAFIGSIPQVEAVAVAAGVGWPAPLARAALGDPTAGPDVVPLLGDARAPVRAAAARALGELGHAPAATALARLRTQDPESDVRAEAAIAALALGDAEAATDVRALLTAAGPTLPAGASADAGTSGAGDSALALAVAASDRARRAALGLARVGDVAAEPTLRALVVDPAESESRRKAGLVALARVGTHDSVPALVTLLSDVRLRIAAAEALGNIGGRPACDALLRALTTERYLPARTAEARGLARQHDRRAVAQVRRFLGMETPMPEGVAILTDLRALARPSGGGADLRRAPSVRRGAFECDDTGCAPGEGATLALPGAGARDEQRAVVWAFSSADDATLTLGAETHAIRRGAQELAFAWPARARSQPMSATPGVRVVAIAVVPSAEEIPPPAPIPWQQDAGTPP